MMKAITNPCVCLVITTRLRMMVAVGQPRGWASKSLAFSTIDRRGYSCTFAREIRQGGW